QGEQERRRAAPGGDWNLVVQPFAESAVAHLIVVLQTDDEAIQGDAGRIGTARPTGARRALPAIEPAASSRFGDGLGTPVVVGIVAVAIAGERDAQLVVQVV